MQPAGTRRGDLSGVSIGKQCVGARYCYREEQVLASNALMQEAITGGIGK
jgi:hypothetical protein